MSCWLNREAIGLLVLGLNLGSHIENDLSEKTPARLSLQTSQKKRSFYKFLNIVDLRSLPLCRLSIILAL